MPSTTRDLASSPRTAIESRPSSPAARPPSASSPAITEATAVVAKLAELGGTPESYEVPAEAIAEVEAVVPEVEAAEVAAGDDLTIIDGIGPVTSDALRAGGVTTFAQVGAMTPEAIEEQLDKANASLIAGHHADSWPRQARLAAAGDWAGLRRYIASTKLATS